MRTRGGDGLRDRAAERLRGQNIDAHRQWCLGEMFQSRVQITPHRIGVLCSNPVGPKATAARRVRAEGRFVVPQCADACGGDGLLAASERARASGRRTMDDE